METPTMKEKILAAVAYVPFPPLFLIPLLAAKNDSFAGFHGKQGLVVFLVWFALWLIGLIPHVLVVAYVGFLALIVAAVFAIVKTFMGQRWTIPLIGKYAHKLQF
jgi:uncharacterized membrane protein